MSNMDLRRKVGYKPRKRKAPRKVTRHDPKRRHDAFLALGKEACAACWEMDTVMGSKQDSACLLTLLHRPNRFQLVLPLDACSSSEVQDTLCSLRDVLGTEYMMRLFDVVLTDNGPEFEDDSSIGAAFGETADKTRLYYCDPGQSQQKAACEKNHVEIRKLLPKGRGIRFDRLTFKDCQVVMSQINSTPRGSLAWMTPTQVLLAAFDTSAEALLEGLRLPHSWDYEEARPRKGDVIREKRRSYIYLFFDASKAAEAERELAGLLRELHAELAVGNRIERHERLYDEYFDVVRGKPVGKDGAIASAKARAGYFALFSNEVMEPFDALAIYRDKDAIEKRFGDVKSLLDFRTPRVSAEETLSGKIFVMFVALVLTAWLRKRMQETGLDEEYTLSGLIDEVETIERYTREGHRPCILEVTLKQRAVFERLGYEVPATS